MIVEIALDNAPGLREPGDFTVLAVHAPTDLALVDIAAVLGGTVAADDHVWIPRATLRELAGEAGPDWSAAFDAMLRKVEPYGWYDPAAARVKAHVERSG